MSVHTLSRKYRPRLFSDVVGQERALTPLKRQIEKGKVGHAYVLAGLRGIGKTTIARLLARRVNCLAPAGIESCGNCEACEAITRGSLDVVEIDAASHTGVDHVRDVIVEGARMAPSQLKRKVFLIDEAHMLSTGAFNALLKTLEEPPEQVLFLLATTQLEKIPDTVQSRCQRLLLSAMPLAVVQDRLAHLSREEGVEVDGEVMAEVARRSGGSMRDAESLFTQVLALAEEGKVSREQAALLFPVPHTERLSAWLMAVQSGQVPDALRALHAHVNDGEDPTLFVSWLMDALRATLLARAGSADASVNPALGAAVASALSAVSDAWIAQALRVLGQASEQSGRYPLPLFAYELAVWQLVASTADSATRAEGSGGSRGIGTQVPATPIATAAPALSAGGSHAFTLAAVQTHWPLFQQRLRERHASLPLALERAKAERVDGNMIVISVAYAFYAEAVNLAKNAEFLSALWKEILGTTCSVHAEYVPEVVDPNVHAVLDAFGGVVVAA